jgi:hypothetical protein
MYEELLNFLLARKKRLLSEEEADKLIELIARSMDLCEEYVEKTDNTALIKKILDNVDVEEIVNEESDSTREAIDDLFYEDYSSISLEDDLAALYGADDTTEPLSRRKFKRGEFGERKAGVEERPSKPMIGVGPYGKPKGSGGTARKANPTEFVSEASSSSNEDELQSSLRAFRGNGASGSNLELSRQDGPGTFRLPEAPTEEDDEFKFEAGELKEVRSFGPDFKFYDEDGEEL